MKLFLPKLNIADKNFLRQCGYVEIANPHKNNEISYARSLDPGRFYPRFHAYLEIDSKGTKINLHLDAKKPSYEGTAAHSGEYDSETIENEAARIKSISDKFILENRNAALGFQTKKSLWQKIKGYFQ